MHYLWEFVNYLPLRGFFSFALTLTGPIGKVHRELTAWCEWFPIPLYDALGLGPQQSQFFLCDHRFRGLKSGIQ